MSSSSSLNSLLNSSNTSSSSNNGVDISSILSATSGNAAAIDVTAAVNAAIAAARQPEDIWTSSETTLGNETSAISAIQTATQTVENDLNSLNNLTGPLAARTATSSSSAVTATAASGSTAGTHSVQVNSLATTASWYSSSESSASSTIATGSVTITSSSGTHSTISTGSGTSGDNLTDLASAVNAAGLGVTASVITDANGARLSIVANSPGSTSNFSVSSSVPGLSVTQATQGADASLVVDGTPIQSASNTVTGAISGVTLTLSGTTTSAATVTVASDTTQVSDAINQFVTDYNSALSLVNTQFTLGSSGTEGVLAGDSTIRNLQGALESATGYTATAASGTTTTVSSLADLGITVNEDGSLSVDSSTLNNALSNNPTDVQNFFQGSALNGFAGTFSTALNVYTDAANGAFTLDLTRHQ